MSELQHMLTHNMCRNAAVFHGWIFTTIHEISMQTMHWKIGRLSLDSHITPVQGLLHYLYLHRKENSHYLKNTDVPTEESIIESQLTTLEDTINEPAEEQRTQSILEPQGNVTTIDASEFISRVQGASKPHLRPRNLTTIHTTIPLYPNPPTTPYGQFILNCYSIPLSASNIYTRTPTTPSYFSPHCRTTSTTPHIPQYPRWGPANDRNWWNCKWP